MNCRADRAEFLATFSATWVDDARPQPAAAPDGPTVVLPRFAVWLVPSFETLNLAIHALLISAERPCPPRSVPGLYTCQAVSSFRRHLRAGVREQRPTSLPDKGPTSARGHRFVLSGIAQLPWGSKPRPSLRCRCRPYNIHTARTDNGDGP